MPDLNFDCPHCGQNLDAPGDLAGMKIDCPACGRALVIPSPAAAAGHGIDEKAPEELKKSSTMRLNLPADLGIPPPSKRVVKIKRLGR